MLYILTCLFLSLVSPGVSYAQEVKRVCIPPERALILFTGRDEVRFAPSQEIKGEVTDLVAHEDGRCARMDEFKNLFTCGFNRNELYICFRAKEISGLPGYYVLRLVMWDPNPQKRGYILVDYARLVAGEAGYLFELKAKVTGALGASLLYGRQPQMKTGLFTWGNLEPLEKSFLKAYEVDCPLKPEREKIDEEWERITIPMYGETPVTLEGLPQEVIFPDSLRGKIHYEAGRKFLWFKGVMTEEERDKLLGLSPDPQYRKAVAKLFSWRRGTPCAIKMAGQVDACEELLDALDKAFSTSEEFAFLWDKSRITPQSVEAIASPIEKERGVKKFSVGMTLYQYQGKSQVEELYRGGEGGGGQLRQRISIKEPDGKLIGGEIGLGIPLTSEWSPGSILP